MSFISSISEWFYKPNKSKDVQVDMDNTQIPINSDVNPCNGRENVNSVNDHTQNMTDSGVGSNTHNIRNPVSVAPSDLTQKVTFAQDPADDCSEYDMIMNKTKAASKTLMTSTPSMPRHLPVQTEMKPDDEISNQFCRQSSKLERREKEPMRYSGKTDWPDYLDHFSAVARWNNWNHREMGIQLAISLTDEAREVLGSIHRHEQHDFDILVDALTRRFSPEGRESQFSLQLMNRVCKSDETVTSYGHAIRRLAHKAYPNQVIEDKILVDLYIKGLPTKEMKRHVYLAKPFTLAQAINCAVTFEAFDCPSKTEISESTRKPKPYVAAVKTTDLSQFDDKSKKQNETETSKLTELLSKMNETVAQLSENVEKLNKPRTFSHAQKSNKMNVECFKCHRKGHNARDCRSQTPRQTEHINDTAVVTSNTNSENPVQLN